MAETVVFGGLVYENGKPTRRLSLQDMVSIKFNENKFIDEFEKLPSVLESLCCFLLPTESYCLHIWWISTTKTEPSSNLFVINIQSNTVLMKVASDDFATAGNSLLFVDNDCLLINEGTQKAMSLLTKKSLINFDKCGLGDAYTIENFVSPIPWIFVMENVSNG